jgi:hypothetical protein
MHNPIVYGKTLTNHVHPYETYSVQTGRSSTLTIIIIIMDHVHIESPLTWHFKNTQPFRNSGAEQRQGCTEHI